jgi:hypothetical protein
MKMLAVLLLAAASAAAGPDPREADRQALLELHRQTLQAHLDRDAGFFVKDRPDDFLLVSRGELVHPSREATLDRFRSYLGATTFSEYKDLVPPVVKVSADGTLGWVAVQVSAKGVQKQPDGKEEPLEFVCAWVSLFEKRDGKWISVGNASNFKEK